MAELPRTREQGAAMAPRQRGGTAPRSPASSPDSSPLPALGGSRLPGRAGLEWPSPSPSLGSPGLICWRRLLSQPRGKCSHWTGRCGLRVSGRKVGEAWRSEGEGGGRREEGGGCGGRSGKLRAAFPPQSVEQERWGAWRRQRLLRHQTPGAPRGLGATSS